MIRTVLSLKATPERVEDVVEFFSLHDILAFSLEHSEALASELSVRTDGSGEIMVTELWPSTEAYQGWIDNPWRDQSNEKLNKILDGVEVGEGKTFEIRQSVSS
ncbi:hypothetical protein [Lysinibacter cavernae]|uniref:Quinol monooxygenase YgiN n=1 Tax=Lysinibacter cavernae TaxID=1640652 RepID=A0A7X5R3C1_9MICO|nr:hypothetical protein [Lysinibacter cavernae]NIH54856.1 quinol monooxygenase YgiN [Lysinibacter cavernae]